MKLTPSLRSYFFKNPTKKGPKNMNTQKISILQDYFSFVRVRSYHNLIIINTIENKPIPISCGKLKPTIASISEHKQQLIQFQENNMKIFSLHVVPHCHIVVMYLKYDSFCENKNIIYLSLVKRNKCILLNSLFSKFLASPEASQNWSNSE